MWTPDPELAERLDKIIAKNGKAVKDFRKYSGDDSGFLRWLLTADAYAASKGVGLLDLADCPYRDWYDDGITPQEAFRLALANEGF